MAEEPKRETPPPAGDFSIVCPHCGVDPVTVQVRNLNFPNGIVLLLAACANPECRKLLGVSFAGLAQPQIVRAGRIIQ